MQSFEESSSSVLHQIKNSIHQTALLNTPESKQIFPTILPYIRKYWQSLNLVICPKSGRNALLAEFKFGSLLRCIIAQISLNAIFMNINMVVSSATAKSSNLNHRQYIFPDLRYVALKSVGFPKFQSIRASTICTHVRTYVCVISFCRCSLLMVFQIITTNNWHDIMYAVIENAGTYAPVIYFVPCFIIINLILMK